MNKWCRISDVISNTSEYLGKNISLGTKFAYISDYQLHPKVIKRIAQLLRGYQIIEVIPKENKINILVKCDNQKDLNNLKCRIVVESESSHQPNWIISVSSLSGSLIETLIHIDLN